MSGGELIAHQTCLTAAIIYGPIKHSNASVTAESEVPFFPPLLHSLLVDSLRSSLAAFLLGYYTPSQLSRKGLLAGMALW